MTKKLAREVTLVRRSRSAACGISMFSGHLATELRARGLSVDEHNVPDHLECPRRNVIVHYVPSMWAGAAEPLNKVLCAERRGRLMVMIHGIYMPTCSNHMRETPCPDLPSHIASISSRADCVVALSRSCCELYSEWVRRDGGGGAINMLLHPGLVKAPRVTDTKGHVFYGGVIRPKKSIDEAKIRRLLSALQESGLNTWVHASNSDTNVVLPEASRVSIGIRNDEEWAQMIANAVAVICPYDTQVQCVSGVIAESISAGTPVVATGFRFAREMQDQYPSLVTVNDDVLTWPQTISSFKGRKRVVPPYPNWGSFTDAVLCELGI